MDREFWLQKWQDSKPGFQQDKVNSRLQKFWSNLQMSSKKVFVPLCGSTIDMRWLMESGFEVFGVEFSEVACRRFFEDNDIAFELSSDQRFDFYTAENIALWRGDFFDLRAQDLAAVSGVYDRAALIALPADIRTRYAKHLSSILEKGCQILLISMDYDQSKMQGPPFSIDESVVRRLFEKNFSIEIVAQSSGPDIVGNLSKRGLDTLNEHVYLMRRN